MSTKNPLDYDHDKSYLPDDCVLNISPSSFGKFVSRKHQWYREKILKEDVFQGSTSSVIGTIVHYIAECVSSKKDIDKTAIDEYINSFGENEDVCTNTVRSNFEYMASVLINGYVLPNMGNVLEVESTKMASLGHGVYVSGTLDRLEGTKEDCCLTDYKTYNSKTKPKYIPQDYKYQLLVYAFMLIDLGYNVTRIKLVYVNRNIDGGISEKTGKALKSYPPEVTVLVEEISDEDMEFIKGLLDLCKESYIAGVNNPELLHVIWNDPRLKTIDIVPVTGEVSIVWQLSDVEDVLAQSYEGEELSHTEKLEVLDNVVRNHDANNGVTWDTLEYEIDNVIDKRG